MKISIPVRKAVTIFGPVNFVHSIHVKDESLKTYILILICLIPLILSITTNQQPKQNLLQPFYCVLDCKTYYIVYNGENVNTSGHFKNGLKYGIDSDEPRRILPVDYEKIYNPNITLLDCFEIKRDGKVGMFNYKTGEILQPRFDYIMPSGKEATDIAYGFLDGKYYQIKSGQLKDLKVTKFNPVNIFSKFKYDVEKLGSNALLHSYEDVRKGHYGEEFGPIIAVVPSWLEYLKMLPKSYYIDIKKVNQSEYFSGTQHVRATPVIKESLSEKLKAFVYDVFEYGVSVRTFELEASKLVVLNTENQELTAVELSSNTISDYFCRQGGYQLISNGLIETLDNKQEYKLENQLYNFETIRRFLNITESGELRWLNSNRHFDATEFVYLEDRHFRGCFGKWMQPEEEDYNIWVTEHLSIEDLDIMRNVIFADYGYRFKSEKWQKFFAKKSWYKPRFDDVNDQLTEIDKANIQFILNMKEKMTGRVKEFTKPRKDRYVAAG